MNTHELKDLAAIITIDFHDSDRMHKLTFVVWQDCGVRVTCPNGRKLDIDPLGGNLEATINDIATSMVHIICACSQAVGRGGLQQVRVHRVPRELTTSDQILAWMQTSQGIIVENDFLEGGGFPVVTPPSEAFVDVRRTGKPHLIN